MTTRQERAEKLARRYCSYCSNNIHMPECGLCSNLTTALIAFAEEEMRRLHEPEEQKPQRSRWRPGGE